MNILAETRRKVRWPRSSACGTIRRAAAAFAFPLVKILRLTPLLACLLLAEAAAQTIPAFPGAEGAGAFARGGRGGDVYHVTNVNSSGAGSLAYGLTTGVPAAGRTIVFDVSGYVTFSGEMRVAASKITIAGQTAPGDGFGLKGGSFRISGDEIIVRHLRFRNGTNADCLNMDSGSLNAILDHCDTFFSTDENFSSFSSAPENVTFQWSLNMWGLEPHPMGGLWDQNHATCHHTLWGHQKSRNPKARPFLLDWVNNVTFDWDIGFILADSQTPANWNANVIGNYWVSTYAKTKALEKGGRDRNGNWNFHVYLANNRLDGNANGVLDGTDTGWGMVSGDIEQLAAPLVNNGIPVTIDDPLTAYKKVLSAAGPLRLDYQPARPLRDDVAALAVADLVSQTRRRVSSPTGTGLANGGYGLLNSTAPPVDTDRDGMPDDYELTLGWAIATQDHASALASSGAFLTGPTFFPPATPAGYTRLEEYLHFLAVPHAIMPKSTTGVPTAIDIDLRKFTSGFVSAPVFTLANVVGGAATQSGAGGSLVHFVPTTTPTGVPGRAGFRFTVLDGAGSQWTQQFAILVSAAGVPRDLRWQGDGSQNLWNTSTNNWVADPGVTAFSIGDNVLFDNLGSATPGAALTGAMTPGSITIDSSKNYTFTGSGSLSSAGPLTKRGPGTLTIANTAANSFPSITLDEGTLTLPGTAAAGVAPITLNGGTLVLAPPANTSIGNALIVADEAAVSATTVHNLNGSITGGGVLHVKTASTWTLVGSTSAFAGRFDLGTTASDLRLNGGLGSPLATFDLGTGTGRLYNRNGNVNVELGALAGGPATALRGASAVNAPSTYVIGALGGDSTFQGAIVNGTFAGSPATHIEKVGAGTLTLSGVSSYTGSTAVNVGTLVVDGSLGNTALTVASGATLRGDGSIGGPVTLLAGAKLSAGSANGGTGSLSVGAGLALQGATFTAQLRSSATAANDLVTMNGGTLALSGANPLVLDYLDGWLGAGTYLLVDGGAATTGGVGNLNVTFPTGTRQTYQLSAPSGKIQIAVAGNPAVLTWTGGNGGVWDLNATDNNWTGGPTNTFYHLDTVNFTDASALGSVAITGAVQPVLINVSNVATAFTFTGSGAISGGARLVKNGSGTLTLSNTGPNTFTGGTTLNAGTLVIGTASSALGGGRLAVHGGTLSLPGFGFSNSVVFSGPSAITVTGNVTIVANPANTFNSTGAATVNLAVPGGAFLTIGGGMSGFTGTLAMGNSAGMLRLNNTGSANRGSASALFDLGSNTATLANRNGGLTINLGAVQGGPGTRLQGRQSGAGVTESTYLIGGLGTDHTFAGTILTGGDQQGLNIVKVGAGNWTLSGSSNFTGALTVQQGRVTISGSFACSGAAEVESGATLALANGIIDSEAVNIAAGAQCTGSGTIAGDLNNHGTLTCGLGTLTVVGDLINNGTMRITGGATLNASGTFTNNGVLDLLTGAPGLPADLVNGPSGLIIDSTTLKTIAASKSGNVVTITIGAHAGHTYQLQRSDSLSAPSWINVGSPSVGNTQPNGQPTPKVFTDPAATGARRYYRVTVTP